MSASALCLVVVQGELPSGNLLVLATQRFRGAILREAIQVLCPDVVHPTWEDLSPEQRQILSGISGKDAAGKATEDAHHLVLFPWYGVAGESDRLYAWKRDGLNDLETAAILSAARRPVRWGTEDRILRLAPFGRLPLPQEWVEPSVVWESATPFVPASTRHRFRPNGKPKNSETPEKQVAKLCVKRGLPLPEVECVGDGGAVRIHWTWNQRNQPAEQRPATHWPGYRMRLRFPERVSGPIYLGNSCHFGLGLFERGQA